MASERGSDRSAAPGGGMDAATPASETATLSEVSRYIALMCGELHQMAQRSGLGVVASLLNLARAEAELHVDEQAGRKGREPEG